MSKQTCTREQRLAWSQSIHVQLALLGLDRTCPPVDEVMRKVEVFVETGQPQHGSIRVTEVERRIDFDMNNYPDPADPTKAKGRVDFVFTGNKKLAQRKKKAAQKLQEQ